MSPSNHALRDGPGSDLPPFVRCLVHSCGASLLVRSPKVAAFYEKIFLYDWENLTNNDADESIGGIRRALPGEETPPGFKRVKISELLAED